MEGVDAKTKRSPEVTWCVARFPFDVAAKACFLHRCCRFACEQCVNRTTQVFARDLDGVARTTFIELASVHKVPVLIEEIKVRGASRPIGFGDGLGGVVEIREDVAGGLGLLSHICGAISRIISDVVGIDANDRNAARLIIAGELRQAGADVLHVRAMIAHENHHQPPGVPKIGERNHFTGRIRKMEIRSLRSQGKHR